MEDYEYCQCKQKGTIIPGYNDDEGYWFVCSECGLRIKGEYNYYGNVASEEEEGEQTLF